MKNDLAKGFQLMRFCLSKYTNFIMMVVFFCLGLTMELLESSGAVPQRSGGYFPIGIGAIFLVCTAIFPPQMAVSLDVCLMAQASPYKKKLQTSIFAGLMLISILAIFTLIVVIRCVGIALRPELSMKDLNILPVGLFTVFIIVYSGVVYKFFILSVVVLWLTMMGIGGYWGFMNGTGQTPGGMELAGLTPVMSIAVCYLMIVAAVGLEYLISVALYRFPLSKFALRCSRGSV